MLKLTFARSNGSLPHPRVDARHHGRPCQPVSHVTRVVTRISVSYVFT